MAGLYSLPFPVLCFKIKSESESDRVTYWIVLWKEAFAKTIQFHGRKYLCICICLSLYSLCTCICVFAFVCLFFCICESPGNNHPVPWQGRASKAGGLPGQDLSLCLHSTGSPGITFQLFLFSPNCQYSTKNVPLSFLWDEASCLLEQFSHGAGQQILLWSHHCGWNSLLQNTNKMGSPPFSLFFSSPNFSLLLIMASLIVIVLNWVCDFRCRTGHRYIYSYVIIYMYVLDNFVSLLFRFYIWQDFVFWADRWLDSLPIWSNELPAGLNLFRIHQTIAQPSNNKLPKNDLKQLNIKQQLLWVFS